MALATLPSRRTTQKPAPGSPIDWANPLSRALFSAVLFNDNAPVPFGALWDAAAQAPAVLNQSPMTTAWNPSYAGGPFGGSVLVQPVSSTPTTSETINAITAPNPFPLGVGLTLLARVRLDDTSAAGTPRFICTDQAANGTPIVLATAFGANTQPRFLINGTSVVGTAGQIAQGVWAVWAGVWDGHTAFLYKDGKLLAQAAVSSSGLVAGTHPRYMADANGDCAKSAFDLAYCWGRALGPAEVAEVSAQPFTLFPQPFVLRMAGIAVPPSGGSIVALSGNATVDLAATGALKQITHLAGAASIDLGASGALASGSVTYTPPNLALDTASAIYGGSNLVSVGGVIQLAHNRPAVDASHLYYTRAEDGTGTAVTEDSTNANTGALNANVDNPRWEWSAYQGQGAARFDATGSSNTNQHINVGSVLHYEYTQPWTAWTAVKGRSGHAPAAGGAAIIFTNCQAVNTHPGFELWVNDANHLQVRIIHDFTGGAYIGVKGSTAIVDGSWHTVCATYDGSGTAAGVKLYVDGVADTLTVESDTLGGQTIVTTDEFWIGNQNGWPFSFPGLIDEFRLFNVAQSPTWVASHATSVPAVDANTALAYSFEETSGTTVHDASANGFNGTASDDTILTAFGMGSSSLRYFGGANASGANVSFPHIAAYNLGSAFTLMSWANNFAGSAAGVLLFHVDTASPFPGWGWWLGDSSTMQFWDGTAFQNSTIAATTGWHLYALRFNAGTLEFFVDGVVVKTLTGVNTPSAESALPLELGNWPSTATWSGIISNTHISSVKRSDAYMAQFATAHPASGIASLASPSTVASSGGGDFGSVQSFTALAAAFSTPTTTGLQYRVGASSTSAADATTQKLAAAWTTLTSSQSLTGVTGRWLDFDVKFAPSTDTLARDTPQLSSLTVSYTAAGGTAALTGNATLDLAAAGVPETIARMAGVATIGLSATGAPTLTVKLAGAASLDATAAGSLGHVTLLSGNATIDLSALGLPHTTARLAGTATVEATAAGSLHLVIKLTGGASIGLAVTGALGSVNPLAPLPGGPVVTAVSAASGLVSAQSAASGTVRAQSAASGTIAAVPA